MAIDIAKLSSVIARTEKLLSQTDAGKNISAFLANQYISYVYANIRLEANVRKKILFDVRLEAKEIEYAREVAKLVMAKRESFRAEDLVAALDAVNGGM